MGVMVVGGDSEARWRRLLCLVRSKSTHARKQGGKELSRQIRAHIRDGDADQRAGRSSLAWIVVETMRMCIGTDWETRTAACNVIEKSFHDVFCNDGRLMIDEKVSLMKFDDVNLESIFQHAKPLVSKRAATFGKAPSTNDLRKERAEALKNIRLACCNIKDEMELSVLPDDFANETPRVKTEKEDQVDINEIFLQKGTRKRKSSSGKSTRLKAQKRLRKTEKQEHKPYEADLEALLTIDRFQQADSVPHMFSRVWVVFIQNILNERWEARQGASTALLAIIRSRRRLGKSTYSTIENELQDIVIRCICVLGMDRFGDYALDNVVAPVRESCAQLLALCASMLPQHFLDRTIDSLCTMIKPDSSYALANDVGDDMYATTLWGRRYGSLLAVKYILRLLRRDEDSQFERVAQKTLPLVMKVLIQESKENVNPETNEVVDTGMFNDEVRTACSEVVLGCLSSDAEQVKNIIRFAVGEKATSLAVSCNDLWELLTRLDVVVMASAGSIIQLASRITCICPGFEPPLLETLPIMLNSKVSNVIRKGTLTALLDLYSSPDTTLNLVTNRLEFLKVIAPPVMYEFGEANSQLAHDSWDLFVTNCCTTNPDHQILDSLLQVCFDWIASTSNPTFPAAYCVSSLLRSQAYQTFMGTLLENVENQAQLSFLLQAAVMTDSCTRVSIPATLFGRDWGPQSDECVLVLRKALWNACKFLCDAFVSNGLSKTAILSTAPGDLILQSMIEDNQTILKNCENQSLVDAAHAIVATHVTTWVTQLSENNMSREDFKQWNESTTATRELVVQTINDLAKARKKLDCQERGLESALKFQAVSKNLPESIGGLVKPLVKTFTSGYSFDENMSELLARTLVSLLGDVFEDVNHRKALEKIPLLIYKVAISKESQSFFKMLSKQYSGELMWDLVPSIHSQLSAIFPCFGRAIQHLPSVGDKCKKSDATHAANILCIFSDNNPDSKLYTDYVSAILGWVGELDENKTDSEALFLVLKQLLQSFTWKGLLRTRNATWAGIHRLLLPHVILNRHANPASRVYALRILESLLDDVKAALPYVAGIVLDVNSAMQDGEALVRRTAATCFAKCVQLVPIEHKNEDADLSVGIDLDDSTFLESKREKGRSFFLGLLAGVTNDPSLERAVGLASENSISLREYQVHGVKWLAFLAKHGLSGALCDDLGLGKTLMALTQIAHSTKLHGGTSLVVCPSTLTGHWAHEIQKWYPNQLGPLPYVGAPAQRHDVLSTFLQGSNDTKQGSVFITSYQILRRDVDKLMQVGKFNYILLDEAHTIRNPYSALAEASKRIGVLATHRLALTGTPVQNDVTDLWSVFDFLMPGYLGEIETFESVFAKPIRACRGKFTAEASPTSTAVQPPEESESEDDEDKERGDAHESKLFDKKTKVDEEVAKADEALQLLHRRVLPFILRRRKDVVESELPKKVLQDISVTLSPLQQRLYNLLMEDNKATSIERVSLALKVCSSPLLCLRSIKKSTKSRLTKMMLERQVSKAKEDVNASCKFAALRRLFEDLNLFDPNPDSRLTTLVNGGESEKGVTHKAIVFAQLKGTLDLVEEQLLTCNPHAVARYMRLDNEKPEDVQDAIVRFSEDQNMRLLLLTTKKFGQGINLTAADVVIFLEHDWNPMNDLQAMDRAHRIGQTRTVNVFRILTQNTIEERVMNLQRFKTFVAKEVITDANTSINTLHTEEIVNLLEQPPECASDASSSSKPTKGVAGIVDELDKQMEDAEHEYKTLDVEAFIRKL
mmetsp:Transcript_35321/g.56355  ORF Transcript_35321/g.56355 Transcript_35321/m.56355 type:complete len:1755 (-) Transcript_35321:595-5859(-)